MLSPKVSLKLEKYLVGGKSAPESIKKRNVLVSPFWQRRGRSRWADSSAVLEDREGGVSSRPPNPKAGWTDGRSGFKETLRKKLAAEEELGGGGKEKAHRRSGKGTFEGRFRRSPLNISGSELLSAVATDVITMPETSCQFH